jgi:hypothetical protein
MRKKRRMDFMRGTLQFRWVAPLSSDEFKMGVKLLE